MARRTRSLLFTLALATSLGCIAAQYGDYDYGYGYGYDDFNYDDFGGDTAGGTSSAGTGSSGGADDFYYDEYGYYGDEDEQYYDYYGYYADDFAGYGDDYYDEDYDMFQECTIDSNGKPVLANNTVSCDIKITGVDKLADKLPGGIDGVYKLMSCHNGKPMYRRTGQDDQPRTLWFSSTFGDWDVSSGKEPNESEILMYGGEMEHNSVPVFVKKWSLGIDLQSQKQQGLDDTDYTPIEVKVACADGKVYDEKKYNQVSKVQQTGPILTDDEMEKKYKYLYDTYKPAPSPTVNFTFVVLLVMTGLTIVLAIPYFLLRKKPGKGGKGGSGPSSFAQLLAASKKKQSGHIN